MGEQVPETLVGALITLISLHSCALAGGSGAGAQRPAVGTCQGACWGWSSPRTEEHVCPQGPLQVPATLVLCGVAGFKQLLRACLALYPICPCFVHFWLLLEPWASLVSGLSSAVAPSVDAADSESQALAGPGQHQLSPGLVLRQGALGQWRQGRGRSR